MAITVDGRPGIGTVFSGIPIQMCHFHMQQIATRYLTKKPKLEASKQLKHLLSTLTRTNQRAFKVGFNNWLESHTNFLNQKTYNPITKRSRFTHKRLRSCVRSIQRNLEYLFTYQEPNYIGISEEVLIKYLQTNTNLPESKLPTTTNTLDGWFAHLKKLLNCHNGLRNDRKHKMIEWIIRNQKHGEEK